MHTKEYNGLEIKYPGPDLYEEEIQSIMADLHKQIEEIGKFPDRSLFFQNPKIFEDWWLLVKTIKKIEVWGAPDNDTEWEDRTETYVSYLLAMRSLYVDYVNLVKLYYEELKKIIDDYNSLRTGDCISADTLEALFAEYEPLELNDINLYLSTINKNSHDARHAVYKTLTEIYTILSTVMDSGLEIVMDLNPSIDDITLAIDNDLKEWNYSFSNKMVKDMKEELNRHYKQHPTDHNTPELWGEMLRADEDALKMAMRQQLSTCEDVKQEHWGEDMKKQMDENRELMRLIYSSCYTEELFDLGKVENVQPFFSLLTTDNLEMFYDIIVRRSLIQCEIFPVLNKQHEDWLNKSTDEQDDGEENSFSEVRQSKLDEIIGILQKGNWKAPATIENIKLMLNTIFGRDLSLLDENDSTLCEKMWALVESGTGERMVIVPANLAGFFSEENILAGSPMDISKDLFGNSKHINNINKGNSNRCSRAFTEVIPFIRKYINKIIRQA